MSNCGRSPVLDVLDFFDEIASGGVRAREYTTILVVYASFILMMGWIWKHFSDQDFSFVLTVSGALQTLAFFLLLHKVRVTRSSAGVSSKTLQMYLIMLVFRLSSTLVKNGYLPVDSTGDWLYQASDIASLCLVFQLLGYVHKKYRMTYQAELDTMPIWQVIPGVILLACVLHGHLNHSYVFDVAWACHLYIDTIAMLPQLWMLVAKGGEVEALTAHFVGCMFFSRCMTWCFWYTGFPELAPENGGFNKVGWMILGAHSLQLLLSADFMYHYLTWAGQQGCAPCVKGSSADAKLVLPTVMDI